MSIRIIWPERRLVPEATISTWYHDAVANGEVDDDHKGIPDSDPRYQAMVLHDIGHITLTKE